VLSWIIALLLSAPTAGASGWACEDCCREAGLAGCPTRIRVYGDGSLAVKEGPVWRIKGMWIADCDDGVRFEPGATAVTSTAPLPGEVVRLASPPATVRCFQQACQDALPEGACITEQDGQFRLLRCADRGPLTRSALLRAPAPAAPPPPPPPLEPVASQDAPFSLPGVPAPGADCRPASAVVQQEAARRRAVGDSAQASGALEVAAREYLAAISMDRCSADGWSAVGALALAGGWLDTAKDALDVAVRLDARHVAALTALGQLAEQEGRAQAAVDAYQAALAAQPDHQPALAGLARLGAL